MKKPIFIPASFDQTEGPIKSDLPDEIEYVELQFSEQVKDTPFLGLLGKHGTNSLPILSTNSSQDIKELIAYMFEVVDRSEVGFS